MTQCRGWITAAVRVSSALKQKIRLRRSGGFDALRQVRRVSFQSLFEELLVTNHMRLNTTGLRLAAVALLGILSAGAASASSTVAAGALSAATPESPEELEELAEVWVRGKRLSDDIETAENEFFRVFNKRNKNAMYDIHCGVMSLQPGSMIMVRACVPGFVAMSTAASARVYVSQSYSPGLDGCFGGCGGMLFSTYNVVSPPAAPVALLAMQHSGKLVDNLLEVINGDPQLLAMAWHLDNLYREMSQVRSHYSSLGGGEKARTKVVRQLEKPRNPVSRPR